MEYRRLGRTDLQVSSLCLGSMTWGEQNSETEAYQQLDYALDHGINFIDTAELYAIPPRAETYGATERIIGNWLQQRHNRDRVILASKVAGPGEWIPHIRNGEARLDTRNIRRAVEGSLQRLQCDYLDLYQVHWPDRKTNFFGQLGYQHDPKDRPTPIVETLSVLGDLVKEGKVRHVAISNETPWGVMKYLNLTECLGLPRIASIQNPYSLLNRSFEIGLAEIAIREQVGLLAYSPLAFGVLSGKYLNQQQPSGARLTRWPDYNRYSTPQAQQATADYVALAQAHGVDPAQMALAYVTSRPFVTSNIIGATTMAQLASNIDSCQLQLSDELLAGIEQIHQQHPNPSP